MTDIIRFRDVEARDFPKMHKWLCEKHVRAFYQPEEISLEQVIAKYQQRLESGQPTRMHMAILGEEDLAYLQSYRVMDFPEYSQTIEEVRGFSIDCFIGDPRNINKGLGPQMLAAYLEYAASSLFQNETHCFVCIREDNLKSIRASKAAGFTPVRNVIEDGHPSLVLQKEL